MAQADDWQQLFPVVSAKAATLTRAFAAVKRYQLSFWDALLWATIREAGITTLLSEDFQHERHIEGVQIINPFRLMGIGELFSWFRRQSTVPGKEAKRYQVEEVRELLERTGVMP